MKKIFFLPALIVYVLAAAQTKVPPVVSAAFAKQFSGATKVKWGKENSKEYEADFELKGTKMSANYDLLGNWKETETEISIQDLPEAVAKSISSKYHGAVISGAAKIERPAGKIAYEANMKMNGKKKEVEVYADGRFVK